MAINDRFPAIRDWSSWLYRGDAVAVDRFLDAIDATLPPGWVRDREHERPRLQSDQIRCHTFDRPGDQAVRLWLRRASMTRVHGHGVQVLRYPPLYDPDRVEGLVAEFADGCVLPAAEASGVRRTRPAFGARSVVGAARSLFDEFADKVDGEWPLTGPDRDLWHDLITGCIAEQVAIDRAELGRWLADNGWREEAIPAIVDQFAADSEWWAKRLAAMSR